MQIHRSAGVVIYTNTTAGRSYLLLAAAVRELREETGIEKAKFAPDFRHQIQYFFRDRTAGLIRKTVVFFLASVRSKKVTISHEHSGFEFLPIDAAIKRLKYPTAKQVLQAAEDFLNAR